MKRPPIFEIVLNDLMNDRFKLEAELERCLNLGCNTEKKVNKIKITLEDIAKNDLMVSKWKNYMPIINDEKNSKNGKI